MQPDALMHTGTFAVDGHWLAGVVAFLGTVCTTPAVIRLAHRRQWVAHPKADRWHRQPTALMGGMAIYAGAGLCLLALTLFQLPWSVWLGATVMFVTGLVDDRMTIRPGTKLAAQVIAALILVADGYTFGPGWPIAVSVPLTLFWLIGITNAFNLLDNMDGLATGIAGIAASVLAVFAGLSGDVAGAGAAMAVAGAAGAFLVFNFRPARIFMGDSGSLFLGYMIGALCLVAQARVGAGSSWAMVLASVLTLAVPILDTTLVTVLRKRAGRAVSQGGRDHCSHRLVFLGLSECQAVLVLYALSLGCGLAALAVWYLPLPFATVLAASVAGALCGFGLFVGRANVYAPPGSHRPSLDRRVLLYGAGDAGVGFVCDLQQQPTQGVAPIGFIDDDPRLAGSTVQGLPVVGSFRDLGRIIAAKRPESVLITAPQIPPVREAELRAACAELGVACQDARPPSAPLVG
jgi:UDP-GlcNAc:undecaprenyl-phosphate GlcNAc-1-phosphate transferase